MKQSILGIFSFVVFLLLAACGDSNEPRFISLEEEKGLGAQFDSTILANPAEYPILTEAEYPAANAYLRDIFNRILNSGEVKYRDEFDWQIRLIENDSTLNAFATPGGYVYVYTGLIKYLEQEDDLAGVLGHEIGHADLRHSARALEREYGINALLSILLGNNDSQLVEIVAGTAKGLSTLSYGRDLETEADERSVTYLAQTDYSCAAARSFFQKLNEEEQTGRTPEFLSTHPNPGNRVENITATAQEAGCDTDPLDPALVRRL